MIIDITEKQHAYLRTIVGMDLRVKSERMLHAASHNSDYYDPETEIISGLLDRLKEGQLDHLMDVAITATHEKTHGD